MSRRICVVVTARASYARIKTALDAITRHPDLELQLVVGASAVLERYGRADRFIQRDGFPIAATVHMILEGENLVTSAKSAGIGLVELATVFDNLRPDAVVTIADRFETIATAIAASYMNIPLVHIQGGEISGSIDDKVRDAVTKLADRHLVATHAAADRVCRMGEDSERVHVTGCPSIDIAAVVAERSALDFDPTERYGGVGAPIDAASGDYVVVLQHPVTTEYESARLQIVETLVAVDELGVPCFWFWPNVDAGSDGTSNGIRTYREQHRELSIRFFKHMDPVDFLRLVLNSRCLIGNSSVGIREASFLGAPTVNVGSRQRGRERGANVVDVDHDREAIKDATRALLERPRPSRDTLYGDGRAGERIAEILAECSLG